jgi:pimeloyl-ACP methyl ester carboxylesterase
MSYTPLLLEVFMKWITVLTLLVVVACGGTQAPPAPASEEPTPAAAGGPASTAAGPESVPAGDGVPIAYTVAGSGSPALVFIHGWMCNQSFWLPQVAEFAPTHTVVTIDLAGHGQSGTARESWPFMAFGSDVQAVVEHLGLEQMILVGHSMGAPVALEAARLMPDRVIGVVAADSLHDADWKLDDEQKSGFLAAWEQDWPGTCARFVGSMFPNSADPVLVKRVHAEMCGGDAEIGLALMRQFLGYELGPALEAVDVPVRCINSAANVSNLEANRARHADFDVVTMDGVGHFLMMERPDEFNRHLAEIVAEMSGME